MIIIVDEENDESWFSLSTMAVYVSKTKWTVTRQTLAKWRDDKTTPFPKSKKFGDRKVLYSKQSIDEWLGIHENKLKKRKVNKNIKKIDEPIKNSSPVIIQTEQRYQTHEESLKGKTEKDFI